jgi:hypothetical protein
MENIEAEISRLQRDIEYLKKFEEDSKRNGLREDFLVEDKKDKSKTNQEQLQ